MSKTCLNCNTALIGPYCYQCGQKASTHRITFSSFIQHDLLHGIWHLDKGVLYTMWMLFTRPGFAVRSFIAGKRVMHYNIFALFIIVIAVKTFVDAQVDSDLVFKSLDKNVADIRANEVIDNYYKVFYLMSIPLLSFITFVFLRKLGYNYTEHIVLNCFLLTGGFLYSLIFSIIGLLANINYAPVAGFVALAIYLVSGYYHVTKHNYTFMGYLWRVLAVIILFAALLFIALLVFILVFYGQVFTGTISLGS